MLAVALIGVNLAGAIATSRSYPRPAIPLPIGVGGKGAYVSTHPDGSSEYGEENLEIGYRRTTRVITRPPRATLLQICAPVIHSSALTLLAAALVSAPKLSDESAGLVARVGGIRLPPVFHIVRGSALVVGIIGLNLVGV